MGQIGGWMDRGGGLLGDGMIRMSRALGWNGAGWQEGYCTTAFGLLEQGKRACGRRPVYRATPFGNLILVADGITEGEGEALLEAYQKRGISSLARMLQGSFALALLDEMRGELILSRSRDGKTPLYYREERYRLSFSSQIKGILALSDPSDSVDQNALQAYLHAFPQKAEPTSLYSGVLEFPSGQTTVWNRLGRVTVAQSKEQIPTKENGGNPCVIPDSREMLLRQLYENLMVHDTPFFEIPSCKKKEQRQMEALLWAILAEHDPVKLSDLCGKSYEQRIKELSGTERLRFMGMLYQANLLCRQ
ncbi:MAG: hypothetical protein IKA76_00655 [Clostridia bacterium]|nr:hypothetical protein [Clostridia bacterium]